jgi:hypothetical protein
MTPCTLKERVRVLPTTMADIGSHYGLCLQTITHTEQFSQEKGNYLYDQHIKSLGITEDIL